jgi:hypothetical protein
MRWLAAALLLLVFLPFAIPDGDEGLSISIVLPHRDQHALSLLSKTIET